MVKTPRSRSGARPTTIELGPEEVSRVGDEPVAAPAERIDLDAQPSAAEPPAAEPPLRSEPEPFVESVASARDPRPTESPPEPPRGFDAVPPAASASRGGAGGLLAGLVGGLAALFLFAALQFSGVLPPLGGSGASDTAGLQAELGGLRQEIAELRDAPVPAPDPALAQDLDSLRAEVARLAEQAGSGGVDTTAIDERLAALEQRLAAEGTGQDARGDIQALTERIAAAEALVGQSQQGGAEIERRIAALETTLEGLDSRVEGLGQQPKIALAIAASALKAAADRGAPFQAELQTLSAIAPQLPEAEGLAAYAETGVATREQLLSDWNGAADAMLAADGPANPDAGFLDRLMSSAENLVSVRPIGDVAGGGVAERLARMEVALNGGDLAKALAEFDELPEPVKAAGAPFAENLRARIDVERLVDAAISNAMKAA